MHTRQFRNIWILLTTVLLLVFNLCALAEPPKGAGIFSIVPADASLVFNNPADIVLLSRPNVTGAYFYESTRSHFSGQNDN